MVKNEELIATRNTRRCAWRSIKRCRYNWVRMYCKMPPIWCCY